jgi:hypothetical protein
MTEEKEQQKEGQDQGSDPQKIEQLISKGITDLRAIIRLSLSVFTFVQYRSIFFRHKNDKGITIYSLSL